MYWWKYAREQNVSEIYRSLYKAKCQTSILLFVWLPTHYFFSLWMASWNGTLGNIEKGLKKRNEWPATIKLGSMELNWCIILSTVFPDILCHLGLNKISSDLNIFNSFFGKKENSPKLFVTLNSVHYCVDL